MTNQTENQTDFDSTNLILFLYTWWKPLIIVTIIAAIAAVVFSSPYFIKPKFKSGVVMFPTTSSSISKALLSNDLVSKRDILEFGEEEQAEQMIQILNSDEIKYKIIQKYDLIKHYGLEDSKYPLTSLNKEYESNITFRRTEFMAVIIEVLDTDPQMAANIANDIAVLLDIVKNRMQKVRALKSYKIVENAYFGLKNEINEMEDSLTVLRQLGVHDYETQSAVLNEQYAIALAKGNKTGIKALEEKLNILANYAGGYVSLRDNLIFEKERLTMIHSRYTEAVIDTILNLSHKFIINDAYPAEKKSYPIRWLIVVISTFSAFLFCVLVIIGMENIKKFKV